MFLITMATIPAAAASWIATYLRSSSAGAIPEWKERDLSEGSGLNVLTSELLLCHVTVTCYNRYSNHFSPFSTVKQLKTILTAVQPYAIVTVPGSHAKKAAWVASARRAFFTDAACTCPNVELVSRLPTGGQAGPRVPVPIAPRYPAPPVVQPISNAAAAAAIAGAVAATQQQSNTNAANARGPQSLARRPQSSFAQGPQSLAPQPQSSSVRGPQSLARRPKKKAKAARGPQSIVRRPGASSSSSSAAAAASNQQAQNNNMAMQQARYLSSSMYGPIQVHPPYPYMEWMPPPYYRAPSMAPPPAAAPPPPSTTAAPLTRKIKQEPGTSRSQPQQATVDESYWDTRPKNPQEQQMIQQLQQMGFTDVREMLTGIRHVTCQQQQQFLASQVENVMMWIVSQREEAEEAKKLDAARARSEALRAEQARLRKQAAHERLWGSTMGDWISESDLFRGSVVLKEARECLETHVFDDAERKKKLIRFLELEKKARKWYGNSVPWCYLCDLCAKWKPLSAEELVKSIDKEATALETAMYSLSEQQGGVPIIFTEARSKAEKSGRPVSPTKEGGSTNDSDDDDDVIVLKEVSAAEADSRLNSASSNGGKKCEVIELL